MTTEQINDVNEMARTIRRFADALNKIACWSDGPVVTGGFDEPTSARIARAALAQDTEAAK